MKNIKKAFFILTIALVSTAAQARCYDCDDRGVLERTGRAAGNVVEGAGYVAERTAEVPGNFVRGLFGESREERNERGRDQEEQREEKRRERESRRGY